MTAIDTGYKPSTFTMSQIVYLSGTPTEGMRYYTSEAANTAMLQPLTMVHNSATGMNTISAPPHPQPQQMAAPAGASYFVYANRVVDVGNSSKVVYLVSPTSPSNPEQMSMLIQSSNCSCAALPLDQPYRHGQEVYATSQALPPRPPNHHYQQQEQQQVQPMTYMPMTTTMVPKPQQPFMDPTAKLTMLRTAEVCRHYLHGRCNRRKCRFLHPIIQHQVEPAAMTTYFTADSATLAVRHTSQPGAAIAPFGSSLSSSINSYSMPSAQMTWAGP